MAEVIPYEYDLTPEEAEHYCDGSEHQRVREVISEIVCHRPVVDVGCGRGIDAPRYHWTRYLGIDGSPSLVAAARKLNPKYTFLVADARKPWAIDWTIEPVVAVLKAVLEHQHSQEDALTIVRQALRSCTEVLIAWHTPPRVELGEPIIQVVRGHFGRRVYQNTYQREAFIFPGVDWISERFVDNYVLWRLRKP